ncbi:hypothetical protein GALMADRAFT_232061 [Galerina marginata CBS 339.88]|uniref:Uncharacterized protein n=1 Tax=Galerina marginata (strain CBS 339.88) TaxID=685588 RepID=A0A067S937_GALM3|nr:hypothetical protein GALMADRAFT_232061 [Galerina marginata CBS 339.88]
MNTLGTWSTSDSTCRRPGLSRTAEPCVKIKPQTYFHRRQREERWGAGCGPGPPSRGGIHRDARFGPVGGNEQSAKKQTLAFINIDSQSMQNVEGYRGLHDDDEIHGHIDKVALVSYPKVLKGKAHMTHAATSGIHFVSRKASRRSSEHKYHATYKAVTRRLIEREAKRLRLN